MDKERFSSILANSTISVREFLERYYDISFGKKTNKKGSKWRISHSEVKDMPDIIPVLLGYAVRNEEMLEQEILIIVRDEFGKIQTYINPSLVREVPHLDEYREDYDGNQQETNIDKYHARKMKQLIVKLETVQTIIGLFNNTSSKNNGNHARKRRRG